MTSSLAIMLIAHIVIGLVGVAASYAVVMGLAKRELPLRFLRISSLVAFLSYQASWIAGGFYYVVYYGGFVKPVIKSGQYPWAHAFFTEVKEHVFLFLPFVSLTLFLTFWFMGEKLAEDKSLRRAVMLVALAAFLIGVYVTVSGAVISGAVR